METKAEQIVDRYNQLNADRGTLLNHWQEIADYMIPRRQQITSTMTPGGKRNTKIYDGTAIRALRGFSNGMYGHMSNPSYPWFELTTKRKELAENPEVKRWLSDTTERIRQAINSSNAGLAFHEVYTDLGGFGTSCMFVEPGSKNLLNFQTFNVAKCVIEQNAQGLVDTIYRLEAFTPRQCVQQWGDRCSKAIHDASQKDRSKTFEIIHCARPRNDYDWRKIDRLNMPWESLYVEKETKNVLEEGGYHEFPYMVPRWEKDPDESYGRSPAMDALPDVKMLNQMCHDDIRAIQKMIDPPLMAVKETLSTTRTTPGSIVYYKGDAKPEYLTAGTNYQIALDAENQRRDAVLKAFYMDLFLLFAEANDNMTATEIRERVEEKLVLLGPALGRLQAELFDPMLSRCFWILYRGGYIAPVPQALMGEGLDIAYIGKLALAMRQVETQATMSTVNALGPLVQVAPDIVDNFDTDKIANGVAQRQGVPAEFLRPPDAVKKIRQAREAALAKRREDAALAEMADKAPGLGKAPEQGSPLQLLMGGKGNAVQAQG